MGGGGGGGQRTWRERKEGWGDKGRCRSEIGPRRGLVWWREESEWRCELPFSTSQKPDQCETDERERERERGVW